MADGAIEHARPLVTIERSEQTDEDGSRECCRRTWLAALTLAENVLLDQVYERVQMLSSHDAVRECVLALRLLKEAGRPLCAWDD